LVNNEKIYLVGGYTSDETATRSIFTASIYTPTDLGVFHNALPNARRDLSSVIVGNKAYAFGGRDDSATTVATIFTASLSDMTDWGTSTGTLVGARTRALCGIVNDKIFLVGGRDASGNDYRTIESASISDPTTWTSTGYVLPTDECPGAPGGWYVSENQMYIYGGRRDLSISDDITIISVSDPLSSKTLLAKLPADNQYPYGNGDMIVVGNGIYMLAGHNDSVYVYDIMCAYTGAPTEISYVAGKVPDNANTGFNCYWMGHDGKVYTFDNTGKIWRTKYTTTASTMFPVVSGTYDAVPGVTRNGEFVALTSWQRLCMPPWRHSPVTITTSSLG
jgi:hypothetical protein